MINQRKNYGYTAHRYYPGETVIIHVWPNQYLAKILNDDGSDYIQVEFYDDKFKPIKNVSRERLNWQGPPNA